ncbi:hypothetical protein F2Q70_00001860 [Brassica cretica]|uniref:DUF1985 domain-containing protein n=1 Tax=Brassica cretica TaxID=69181 RepID=A0A8S9IX19_BRACR|nr:hypothetical protein F2Q70_00001860 [Brassica cretica]
MFIKFKELNFGWASRLVHYMLSFQLNIKKKFELWSLVGPQPVRFSLWEFEHLTGLNCDYIEDLENSRVEVTKEMVAFWEMLGVDVDPGPTTEHIKAAFGRCEEWSREDRKRLGYLAIFTGFIEGRKYSTATRASLARLVMDLERFENYPWGRVVFKVLMESMKGVNLDSNSFTVNGFGQVLQVWAYFALPEFGANFGHPLPDRLSPLLLAYNGGKGRRFFKEAISKQTSVINFVHKDYAEIFQLNIKKKFELWSLVRPQPVRFSLLEFEHLTGLNCDYIEDLENPRVEVTKEMAAFWEMMGVDVDAGPITEHIKAALGRCEEWPREDRMRFGYLAIFTGFIEGRKYSTAIRASLARLVMDLERFENYPLGRMAFKVLMESVKGVNLDSNSYTVDGFVQVLQVWAYFALPEFGAYFGHPLLDRPSLLLLAYNGGKGRRFFKETISKQTSVINFVHKDYAEMFPRWDFDVEDPAAENIIKFMFNAKANWKWTMDCWEVTGTNLRVKKEVSTAETESGVKEESARPRKKARKEASVEASKVPSAGFSKSDASTSVGGMTKEQIEKSFKDIADVMRDGFGMCLKEIKLLRDRMEAVEKKM